MRHLGSGQTLDEEFISHCGQLTWASTLASLGGEYEGFATLAHTQEDQCEQLLLGAGDEYEEQY